MTRTDFNPFRDETSKSIQPPRGPRRAPPPPSKVHIKLTCGCLPFGLVIDSLDGPGWTRKSPRPGGAGSRSCWLGLWYGSSYHSHSDSELYQKFTACPWSPGKDKVNSRDFYMFKLLRLTACRVLCFVASGLHAQ